MISHQCFQICSSRSRAWESDTLLLGDQAEDVEDPGDVGSHILQQLPVITSGLHDNSNRVSFRCGEDMWCCNDVMPIHAGLPHPGLLDVGI